MRGSAKGFDVRILFCLLSRECGKRVDSIGCGSFLGTDWVMGSSVTMGLVFVLS